MSIFFYKITTNILFLFLSSERNADNDLLQLVSVNSATIIAGGDIFFLLFLILGIFCYNADEMECD